MEPIEIQKTIKSFFFDEKISYIPLKDVFIHDLVDFQNGTSHKYKHVEELSGAFTISTAWLGLRYAIRPNGVTPKDSTVAWIDVSTGDRMISVKVQRFIAVPTCPAVQLTVMIDLLHPELDTSPGMTKIAREMILQHLITTYAGLKDGDVTVRIG